MPKNKNATIRYRIIDQLLCNKQRKYPSKEDFAEACYDVLGVEVSTSSIEKDLKAMREDEGLGYIAPIKYNKEFKGYYYDDPEYSINGVPLNGDDLVSIRYAASILKQFKQDALLSNFEEAIDKICDYVDFGLPGRQHIQFEYQHFVKGRELIEEILPAIEDKLLCTFNYQSGHAPEKGAKERKVLPLLLKEYRNRWYLISYQIEKQDIRTWALDRIEDLCIIEKYNGIYPDFDPDEYFKYAFGITIINNTEPKEVILSFNPSERHYLLSQPLHHSQKVLMDNDEEIRISIYCYPCEELERTIRSYGDLVKRVK